MTRTLILGGASSGKSAEAERRFAGLDGVLYVATGGERPDDADWVARVAAHRARRPASWRTAETVDLEPLLAGATGPVLIDCLTLWLTRVMDDANAWDDAAWTATTAAASAAGTDGPGAVGGAGPGPGSDAVGSAGSGSDAAGSDGSGGPGAGGPGSDAVGGAGGGAGPGGFAAGGSARDLVRARVAGLAEAWRSAAGPVIAVSGEVGLGVVPETAAGRRFRDELGRLNQALAAASDQVLLVVAGIPMTIKG